VHNDLGHRAVAHGWQPQPLWIGAAADEGRHHPAREHPGAWPSSALAQVPSWSVRPGV